jgi:type I restriction enzyme S subunit
MSGSEDVGASLVDAQSGVEARNEGDHKGRPYIPDGFKMTALGPLPEEWEVATLGEVADFSGKPGRQHVTDDSLIPFVPMSLLPDDALYIPKWEMRKPADIRSGVFIQEGDLLLAKITPCLENGKQGIVIGLPGGWGYATTEVIPIRSSLSLDSEYLALYLKMPNVRQSLASKMEGTTGRQRLPKTVVQYFDLCG